MKQAKVINVSNVSGGVGKSTTAIELATYFGMNGHKALVVDADMQASATDCIGAKGAPFTEKELSVMSKEEWNTYFSSHWTFGGAKQDGHIAVFPEELPHRLRVRS